MKDNLILAGLAALIIITSISIHNQTSKVLGGGPGESYSSRNITSADASATVPVVVHPNSGTLARILIASSSAPVSSGLRIYDACCRATSTASSTLFTKIRTDAAEQSIEVGKAFANGIVLDVPAGFTGNFTFIYSQ